MANAYIVGAVRTATGRKKGRLSRMHPIDMGAAVIDELVDRTGIPTDKVDDVVFGVVMQIGAQAGNLGRNVAMSSKLALEVPGTTVDRQCGSSLQAIQFGAQAVMSGTQDVVISGGVEAMSTVEIGSNIRDGLEHGRGVPKGERLEMQYPGIQFSQFDGAELLAEKYGISREELDAFGLLSHQRAAAATKNGYFNDEIVPLNIELEDGSKDVHTVDEGIRFESTLEGMQSLNTLREGGVITAGTASQISDGAAAIMVANEDAVQKYNLPVRAKIHSLAVVGSDPVIMLEGPIPATEKVLEKAGLTIDDIDLYEVNEAFGSVPLAWAKALNADPEKLNVNGGAQSLGHPLGGTGAKLMTTLVHELERRDARYGLVAICEGGGTANAMIIERMDQLDS
ncbi:MAG: acetyl-CoA C-acyltransferase [Pseudomonadales bacterium]|jgi:acetyl-CoA C-acetyltransferase/acetyl-CoA acyltransferase|uniref:Acetyl-CoA C-acyltransferase n=1 Tax=OM182 bacterium TaxID=2510334 RepID=A0A520S2P5_9GAMM|nr:acetyl-CoA C-acyltransferase [Pseudomonadales bacterium]RPG43577.1 MAG: acetyl-CoA C-acyltransferase [Gammaproteobacteria bacterium TMED163]RZO76701.1 MAG: acetyl-CoA C-acyltransferase [OM182 bacterium]HAO88931.1 acetyl-CoA C-acetyltransferase [Gammaproteobacteria bacterium]HAR91259.1 acetyl-CoA C-acetyltransferase [Gammaproteobacteria bacterium]|tara:strand:- start:2455 stop:3642 length:1188 start_codon:yes stop_codon:yes gene_type:complete